VYRNGRLVAQRSVKGPMATTSGALKIGGNAVWGEFFKGRIDEVRVYARALSPAELQTDMTTSAYVIARSATIRGATATTRRSKSSMSLARKHRRR
jgi:hypothetical protein